MRRKRIALITINPESECQLNIMNGVFAQSEELNLDVAVIAPMVHSSHYFKDYLEGDLNIYELINFDLFDGVLITPVPMQEAQEMELTNHLLEKIQKECHVPVVSINAAFGDYEVVYADENGGCHDMAEHLILFHDCKDIYVLTGPKELSISNERVEGVRQAMEFYGHKLTDDKVFYGDFWYTSGENLGKRIVSGELPRPDAVLCTSDHMAIGLAETLLNGGLRIPEDIIVAGNGGSREAALYVPSITTYESNDRITAARAVNRLYSLMNPGAYPAEPEEDDFDNMCIGGTCGCAEDVPKIRMKIRNAMYTSYYDNGSEAVNGISLTTLLESYISERFTATNGAEACLQKIYESIYLLKPYGYFYLCLNRDWLDEKQEIRVGYPEIMNEVIYSDQAKKLHGYVNHVFFGPGREHLFESKRMLQAFDLEFEKPQVYYFTPVHFEQISIGYAVLQNDLSSKVRIGEVYRNYIRYVENALEMSRAKEHVLSISEHELMTGLYNRRGMERMVERQKEIAPEGSRFLAMMIDMNNLKILNDNYGHEAGDAGIKITAEAVKAATADDREICVRAGGDEFYLIGIGDYSEEDGEERSKAIKDYLERINAEGKHPVRYSAAVGFSIGSLAEESLQDVLDRADVAMYADKLFMKRNGLT